MADNTQVTGGTTGDVMRTVDRAGIKTQTVILDLGSSGTESLLSSTNPLPVTFSSTLALTANSTQSQPLTDTQLRASPFAVTANSSQSQPLTDTQLRASAVPVSLTTASSVAVANLPAALAAGGGLKIEGVAGGVAVPVSGTFFQTTQPVSIATAVSITTASSLPVSVAQLPAALVNGRLDINIGAATTSSTLPVSLATLPALTAGAAIIGGIFGNIAHDDVDSGNPVKIGGKATTGIQTAVADADRVNAWFDENGRLVTSDKDAELGTTSGLTSLRDQLVAQRCTILSDSLADGIAGFWTQTVANGGTIASTGGEGQLKTSTAVNGSAQLVSTNVAYYPGQVAWMNSAIRFGDTGVAGNIRRIGMFTVSGTAPQEGFYYELNGTTLTAVTVKAGVATAVGQASWTRNAMAPFTLDANYVSFEIRYTANTVWFYINNVLRHSVAGTTTPLTSSLSLPITLTNVKTSGATDITFAIRNIGNGRFGAMGGVVAETGLSAVEAVAVGGGTPHDSVDSGNPLKMGSKAIVGAAVGGLPTAVAANDRVQLLGDVYGRQSVRKNDSWYKNHVPAAAAQATCNSTAQATGVRNVCTSLTCSLSSTGAATATNAIVFSLYDGTTAGTVLWAAKATMPLAAGSAWTLALTDLWIEGTAATAMTLATNAATTTNVAATVAMTGTITQ